MAEQKQLLEVRKKMKAKKPSFFARNSDKIKRIRKRWAKPRGLHNKIRLSKKSKPKKVKIGYGSPAQVRGLHRSGLQYAVIRNVMELSGLDKTKHILMIAGDIGDKKRAELLRNSAEKGFIVANAKDPSDRLKKIEEKYSQRVHDKEEATQKKQEEVKKREELAKKKEADQKGDDIAKVLGESEQKDIDRREQEKVLTQKS